MIDRISISNFALIESLDLDLETGLSILSGETGAGKSIIIDALTLLTGGRASTDLIRSGCDKSTIIGIFTIKDEKATEIKSKYDIDTDNQLIVSREIYQSGKSIAKVNNKVVTASLLKEITKDMVDIHGQHEHHSLLDPQKHLAILDLFGGQEIIKRVEKYKQLNGQRKDILSKLDKLYNNTENRERKIDLLKFEIEEIEKAQLTLGEDDELLSKRKTLVNASKLYNATMQGYLKLYQGQDNPAVVETMGTVINELKNLTKYDESLLEITNQLEGALYQVQDAARELLAYGENIDLDTEVLTQVELRIDEINRMKRKYGPNIEDILEYYTVKCDELEELVNSEKYFTELQKKLKDVEESLKKFGKDLTNKRKSMAAKLSSQLSLELAELSMEKTKFEVEFKSIEPLEFFDTGLDDIEFLISPNPGEPLKPLAKIASGGEMSRIMLAIKNILASIDSIATLVFDEVDSGIGGRTAQKVAEKLLNVSQGRQVLCVSHSPQICSMANNHYKIEKEEINGRTISTIKKLQDKERILEIARMISGAEVTQSTINHAREILALADGFKK